MYQKEETVGVTTLRWEQAPSVSSVRLGWLEQREGGRGAEGGEHQPKGRRGGV